MSENALGGACRHKNEQDKEGSPICRECANEVAIQSEAAYQAGVLDGDGTITNQISKNEWGNHDYSITSRIAIEMAYVGGLSDTDGTIDPSVLKSDDAKVGYYIAPNFEMKMVYDESVLTRLQRFADMIDVEHSYHMRTVRSENWSDCFVFTISRRESLKKYLEGLLPFMTVKREQAEIMLNEIIPLLESGAHSRKRGFLEVMEAIDRMNSHKNQARGKYDLEYFEELWGIEYRGNDKGWFDTDE